MAALAMAAAGLGRRLRELGGAVGRRGVKDSDDDFALVQRLLPPTRVPLPPPHPTYPTPSRPGAPERPPRTSPTSWLAPASTTCPSTPAGQGQPAPDAAAPHLGQHLGIGARPAGGFGVTDVQVNEVTGCLRIRGGCERELRAWLLQKGF